MEGRQAGRRGEEKGQVMSWQKGWQQLDEEMGQELSQMRRGLMGESGHVAGCCGKIPNRQANSGSMEFHSEHRRISGTWLYHHYSGSSECSKRSQ